jgi:hypothetical protein
MTQFNVPPIGPHGAAVPPVPGKTSALAIVSLVFALLFCIPFVAPVVGLVCGIIACILIARSGGRVRGTGLAAAGIVVSSIVLLLHVGVTVALVKVALPMANTLVRPIETFISDLENGDVASARKQLADKTSNAVSDEHLRELAALLKDEYGTIQSASFDMWGRAYSMGVSAPPPGRTFGWTQGAGWSTTGGVSTTQSITPGGSIPIKVEFNRKTAFGSLDFGVIELPNAMPRFQVESFTLVGDSGTWTFPFPPEPEDDDHEHLDAHEGHDHGDEAADEPDRDKESPGP